MKFFNVFGIVLFLLLTFSLSAKMYPAKVTRVIDGDTLEVITSGNTKKVRLIGVDTPESAYNNRTTIQAKEANKSQKEIVALGKAAKRYVQRLVPVGTVIQMEYGTQGNDKYGRLLCYVYLPNGKMLNEEIIKNGYAVPLTIPPNVKYKSKFLSAYRSARKNKKGLWQ
jgi:micrococcal nuclease